jgi:hypothetical protein
VTKKIFLYKNLNVKCCLQILGTYINFQNMKNPGVKGVVFVGVKQLPWLILPCKTDLRRLYGGFSSNKARKKICINLIYFLDHALLMFSKAHNCLSCFFFIKFTRYFTKIIPVVAKSSIRRDIRYPALTGYPARSPVSGF